MPLRSSPVTLLAATELWERFTYYGLRALLVLNLVAAPSLGGFGLADADASAVYGLFVACVYLAALPGGLVADRYLGPVRAVWLGGAAIAVGNCVLAIAPGFASFAVGLGCVAAGVGLLKPNVTALVARAAGRGRQSLDAAFTVFYVGINIGGIGGPLLTAALSSRMGWGAGYAAAAAGMVLGLAAFSRIAPRLVEPSDVRAAPSSRGIFIAIGIVAIAATAAAVAGPVRLARGVLVIVATVALAGFVVLYRSAEKTTERSGVVRLAGLFVGATAFWAAGEQAGASLTLFALRFTDRDVLGTELPAAWFQALYPAYVVLLAPLFAMLWTRLAQRDADPPAVAKFSVGLLFGAAALGIAAVGVSSAAAGGASPAWLIMTYLFLALGEILLSPIGLGAATRYAPRGRVGFATGLWFLSLSLGGLLAGLTGDTFSMDTTSGLAAAFTSVAGGLAIAGVVFVFLSRRLRVPAQEDR